MCNLTHVLVYKREWWLLLQWRCIWNRNCVCSQISASIASSVHCCSIQRCCRMKTCLFFCVTRWPFTEHLSFHARSRYTINLSSRVCRGVSRFTALHSGTQCSYLLSFSYSSAPGDGESDSVGWYKHHDEKKSIDLSVNQSIIQFIHSINVLYLTRLFDKFSCTRLTPENYFLKHGCSGEGRSRHFFLREVCILVSDISEHF